MKTNDLKKGMWVLLRNGWHGELWDNMKGNTRVVDVYGDYHEAGSVYSHDIIAYAEKPPLPLDITERHNFRWKTDIEYTPSQLQCRETVNAMGM